MENTKEAVANAGKVVSEQKNKRATSELHVFKSILTEMWFLKAVSRGWQDSQFGSVVGRDHHSFGIDVWHLLAAHSIAYLYEGDSQVRH